MTPGQGVDRGHFDLKTPKSGQKKYLKCPKQVGIDSRDIPGVVLCPSSCHDVEILQFFLKIWSKMVICPKMAQMADLCFIFHFFCVSGNQSPKKKDTFLPYHTYLFGSSHFLCNFSCFLHFF